jgi:hypothetical protein
LIARPHGVRLGGTMRVHMVCIVRAEWPFRSQDGAVGLELIQQQQVIVAGQRGVIMRGRKRSRLWSPVRANDVARDVHRSPVEADAHADDALLALVRLLARQAAREVFARSVTEYDSSVEEGRE